MDAGHLAWGYPLRQPAPLHVIQAITWPTPFIQQVECAILGAPKKHKIHQTDFLCFLCLFVANFEIPML
jgi:hypothetical protein